VINETNIDSFPALKAEYFIANGVFQDFFPIVYVTFLRLKMSPTAVWTLGAPSPNTEKNRGQTLRG